MLFFLLFLGELAVLFLLSRWLSQSMFAFFYLLTRSQKFSVALTTFILFPGTVVHELSHLFVAEILGVRTGKLNLIPEKIGEEPASTAVRHVQAGSVEVSRTDPFRRSIIGLAPIFVGIICITLISIQLSRLTGELFAIFNNDFSILISHLSTLFHTSSFYLFLLLGYLLFTISNNMFSSKEDLKGVPAVLIVLLLFVVTSYVVGIRVSPPQVLRDQFNNIFRIAATNIGIVLLMNTVFLIILQAFIFCTVKILKKGNMRY